MKLFGRPKADASAVSIPLASTFLSTGWPALDAALGGGFRRGSVTLVRGEGAATGGDFRRLTKTATLSILREGCGALIVPTSDESPRQVYDALVATTEDTLTRERLRILDYFSHRTAEPWLVPMSSAIGRSRSMRNMVAAEKALSGSPRQPFLELASVDTDEKIIGKEATAQALAHGTTRAREVGNTLILWIRGESSILASVQKLVDFELVLRRGSLGLFVEGVRPAFAAVAI